MKQINSKVELQGGRIYLGYHAHRRNIGTYQHLCFFRYLPISEGFDNLYCDISMYDHKYKILTVDDERAVGSGPKKFFDHGCVFELTLDEIMLHLHLDEI